MDNRNNYLIAFICFILLCNCKSKKITESYDSPPIIDSEYSHISSYRKVQEKEDSTAKIEQWKPLKGRFLWINKYGDIGYSNTYIMETYIGPYTPNKTYFSNINISLKWIIDIASFKQITRNKEFFWGIYFKDNNNVYYFSEFLRKGSDVFNIVEGADPNSFEMLSNCYARDKNYVYDNYGRQMDSIDPNKFKVIVYKGHCYGKFNNTYFSYGNIMPKQSIEESEMKEINKRFNKL